MRNGKSENTESHFERKELADREKKRILQRKTEAGKGQNLCSKRKPGWFMRIFDSFSFSENAVPLSTLLTVVLRSLSASLRSRGIL